MATEGWLDPQSLGGLAQLGLAGIGLYGFYKAHQWFVQREAARGDRLEAKNEALNALIVSQQEKNLPALTSAVETVQEAIIVLRDVQRRELEREAQDREAQ